MSASPEWYLGPDRAGITEPIVAIEQYRQSSVSQPGGHWSKTVALAASALICAPLVLFRGLGLVLFAPIAVLADRIARRLRGVPNDVLLVLSETRVHFFYARCTSRRGWRVVATIGSFPRGGIHANEVGHFFEVRIALPGQPDPLLLIPAHTSIDAGEIAKALRGPKTIDAPERGRWSPWWLR